MSMKLTKSLKEASNIELRHGVIRTVWDRRQKIEATDFMRVKEAGKGAGKGGRSKGNTPARSLRMTARRLPG